MVPTFVFSIAGQLLGKLSSPIIEELSLAWGLTDDLRRLKNTVSSVRAVLLDAQEQQSNNHQLKHWLEELEDALYHAEDVLEEFEINALRYKSSNKSILTKVRREFSCLNRVVFRFKMAHKIKKIREEFDEIASDKKKFNLVERTNESVVAIRETTHSFVRDEDVIGREDEKQAVIRFINATSDDEILSVLLIVGIGGMGKTTLAQWVFNDRRVETRFDLRIWVCISDDFKLENVIKSILKSAKVVDCDNLPLEQLQQRLREKLKDQKYLLILDDVWNDDRVKWVNLKNLLMGGASGSKIVVTTRNQSVASIMTTTDRIQIQGLPHPQCLSLFLKWAFNSSQEASRYPRLNEIAEEIVEKCKGVPLAIRTLGSLLHLRTKESDWIHVRDNNIWKLKQKEDDIMPVLKFSYDQLPNNLGRCFAFCSIFPKDYQFYSDELTRMWQANGMLQQQSDCNRGLEYVGFMYAKQLFSLGFFQEWKEDESSAKFKMHDLIHDLALLVAERDCINLTSQNFQDISSRKVVRHISFPKDYIKTTEILNWLLKQKKNVHTIAFPIGVGDREASFLKTCISEFKSLRLLDLKESSFQELPGSIGYLKHLKYLDFNSNYLLKSPSPSLCKLVGLETLEFFRCLNIEKLPRGIGKLIRLRTLSITTQEPYLPEDEIRCLTLLKTLVIVCCRILEFLVSDDAIQCLSALSNLVIVDCDHLVRLPTRGLRQLTWLETIEIWGCGNLNLMSGDDSDNSGATSSEAYIGEGLRNLHSLKLEGLPKLEILPPWLLHGANNLKHLHIEGCENLTKLIPEGMEESLKSLHTLSIRSCENLTKLIPEGMEESLKSLHTLKIMLCDNLTKLIPEGMEESLKSLHTLSIRSCKNLTKLIPEGMEESLKSLHTLSINNCRRLVSLPEGMHRLTALGKIEILRCPELSRRCERESGEDWHKISHVPEIILDGRKMF